MRLSILLAAILAAVPSACSAAQLLSPGGCEANPSYQFILRQDFTDVPALGCGDDVDGQLPLALGSRASYSYDDIHNVSAFSLDGLAAADIRYSIPGLDYYVPRISVGPFVQGAGTRTIDNGVMPATTSGSVTTGGYAQFYADFGLPMKLRFRGGELYDSTGVRNGTAVGELIPAFRLEQLEDMIGGRFLPPKIGYFVFGAEYPVSYLVGEENALSGLKLIFAPEIEAQYDGHQGGPLSYALFASHQSAMRLGSLLVAKLYGFGSIVGNGSPFYDTLHKISLSVTYHADWDTLSTRRYYSFQPAIIYNIDASGNYAVTASYGIGDSESSGNRSRQAKVSFSAKF